jgi:hypothetical protein
MDVEFAGPQLGALAVAVKALAEDQLKLARELLFAKIPEIACS